MIRAINIAYLLIVLAAFIIIMAVARNASGAANGFVQMIERREGMFPGQTKVWPDCGCTVRYVGTTVHGNRYTVTIDKLD